MHFSRKITALLQFLTHKAQKIADSVPRPTGTKRRRIFQTGTSKALKSYI